MSNLETLKAQHRICPEPGCGRPKQNTYTLNIRGEEIWLCPATHDQHRIAFLEAKLQQHEATIAELRTDLRSGALQNADLQTELTTATSLARWAKQDQQEIHKDLDDLGAPRLQESGLPFSVVGRVRRLIAKIVKDDHWCATLSSLRSALATAQATIQQQARELEEAHETLRSLASWVGNGGYNAPSVDAKQFEAKIRDGVGHLISVEVNRALSDADTRAHAWWAHTGPHKSLREAIHNGQPAWARHSARAQQENEAEKGEK